MDAKRLVIYSLTPADVQALWEAQGGVCPVCHKPLDLESPAVVIDHDHATGVIRGLLCFRCNRALGLLSDIIDRLKNALAYLLNPPALAVLGQRYGCIGRAKVRTVPRARRGHFFTRGTAPASGTLSTVYRCGCIDYSDRTLKLCPLHGQPKIVEQGATLAVDDANTCPVREHV